MNHRQHPAPTGTPLPGRRPSVARELAARTVHNALTIVATIALVVGVMMVATTPGLALWYDGRLTDLGALTVVPAIIVAVFGLLWWVAPHLELLAGVEPDVDA